MLDSTASQQITALPLRYDLSSVVAHSEDFVNINDNVESSEEEPAKEVSAEEDLNGEGTDEEGGAKEESNGESPISDSPNELSVRLLGRVS